MNLYNKTLAIISVTFVGLIAVLYAASQSIVLGSFSDLEGQDTLQNVQRVESALTDNLATLAGTTRDWSLWDDTYAYIQDHNDAYYTSNLQPNAAISSNRLNLMLFIDTWGKVVFAKSYDYRKQQEIPVPAGLQAHIGSGSFLLRHPDSSSGITGILPLKEGPMLIASEPILRSDESGPARGTLIFGRYLDTAEIQHLAKSTLVSLTAHQIADSGMSTDFKDAFARLSEASPMLAQRLNEGTIAGYGLLKDVYGKPTLILRAEMPRTLYARGLETVRYYMLAIVGVSLIFELVILMLLAKLVLSRLARLSSSVNRIGAQSDLSARVAMPGSDEIGELARSLNGMLGALEQAHKEQKESEQRYRAVVEQASEAICLVDVTTRRFVEANSAAESLFGYTADELLSLTIYDLIAEDRESIELNIHRTLANGHHAVGERRYRRKDGSIVDVDVTATTLWLSGSEVLCIVVRDITDRKRSEEVLRELAMRDGLTGLYNRREMQRILKEEVERYFRYEQPTALILADIDHFKTVNDTYGHQVGDEVLRWIAQLFRELVRSVDKVARYGGEEIAVILPEASTSDAYDLAERLRHTIEAQPFAFAVDDEEEQVVLIPITISAGVASLPGDADSEDALIVAADQALYKAKADGRNRTVRCGKVRPSIRVVS